ncbi:hypothetical protein AQUCO_01200064v1, partial [Aquilegia coerulea]
ALLLKQWENDLVGIGQKYAMCYHFEYRLKRNDMAYIKAVLKMKHVPGFTVPTLAVKLKVSLYIIYQFFYDHDHTSTTDFTSKRKVSKSLIGALFHEKTRDTPSYTPTQIVNDFKQDYDITLPYKQAWRAKEFAKKIIYGKVDDTYCRLPWYCDRIRENNPGSAPFVEMDGEQRFRRLFVAFHGSITGFRRACRRMLFSDCTHLKARFKGTLLSACGPDADNWLLPVAFVVVSGQTFDDWEWFLRNLKQVIDLDEDIVIVSDRHPNIIFTVELVFKKEFHSYTAFTILRMLVKCLFSTWLIYIMRKKIMKKHYEEFTDKWKTNVGPVIDVKLRKNLWRARKFYHYQSAADSFEVFGDDFLGHTVDMTGRKCPCLVGWHTGLPCAHACHIMKTFKLDPTLFNSIHMDPIKPMETWNIPGIIPDPFLESSAHILPPHLCRGSGRPKKRRIESQKPWIQEL